MIDEFILLCYLDRDEVKSYFFVISKAGRNLP